MANEASPQVMRAAAQMAVWGPCRASGDDYLACVALKGKGQCQSLRHLYEQCMRANVGEAFRALEELGEGPCGHIKERHDRMECAAKLVIARASAHCP